LFRRSARATSDTVCADPPGVQRPLCCHPVSAGPARCALASQRLRGLRRSVNARVARVRTRSTPLCLRSSSHRALRRVQHPTRQSRMPILVQRILTHDIEICHLAPSTR
jgi:hypothetical protein